VPSLLFSAVLATIIVLPWAVDGSLDGSPDQPRTQAVDPLLLVEKPLDGVGGGETVRDVRQDTPFSMVALTATDLAGTSARVRAQKADGSWGPWYEADPLEGEGDGSSNTHGTEPVFVGETTHVQIAVTRPVGASPTGTRIEGRGKAGLGYVPANVEAPTVPNFNAILISPPEAPVDVQLPAAAAAPGQAPAIINRGLWGADESLKCGITRYDNGVRAGVVHHTAGSNDYRPEDSAGIVRSIYEYHTRTLGWCDMAYNALVDKYGQVFEGRAGGIDRPVQGAHTGGFNENTWGVAMMGDFGTVPPTPIQLRTTGRLLGWRLGLDHVNPKGSVVLTSDGGNFTNFPRGAAPTLPTIFSHRDVGNTECPGNAAYAEMDLLRDTRRSVQRSPRTADARRHPARRRDLRQVVLDRRRRQRTRITAVTRGVRRGQLAVRQLRQRRHVLVARQRSGTRDRSYLRGVGRTRIRARRARTADQRRDPRTAVDRAELPARHAELRPGEGHRHARDRRRANRTAQARAPRNARTAGAVHAHRALPLTPLEPPPLEHARQAVVGVRHRHLVGGLDGLRVRIAHRHTESGPPQHRHVVGHVPEGHDVLGRDAEWLGHLGDTGRLADADRHHPRSDRCSSST
jgi:uncharacterized protein with LGFP repeats